jgi:hypothetical protein
VKLPSCFSFRHSIEHLLGADHGRGELESAMAEASLVTMADDEQAHGASLLAFLAPECCRQAAAGARHHGVAQPLHLRREQGDHRRGWSDIWPRGRTPRARCSGCPSTTAPPRPPLAARAPSRCWSPSSRPGARGKKDAAMALYTLCSGAQEPAMRRGGRRRVAPAGPHGRPGVRHGGHGRVRPPLHC